MHPLCFSQLFTITSLPGFASRVHSYRLIHWIVGSWMLLKCTTIKCENISKTRPTFPIKFVYKTGLSFNNSNNVWCLNDLALGWWLLSARFTDSSCWKRISIALFQSLADPSSQRTRSITFTVLPIVSFTTSRPFIDLALLALLLLLCLVALYPFHSNVLARR